MNHPSTYHIGFVDGVSRWTWNLASESWVIYTATYTLLQFGDMCLGPATNNQEEYVGVIGL
jgi:hypothetical protein